jgi:hypothetical protein
MLNTELIGNPVNWLIVGLIVYLWAMLARHALGKGS